MRCLLPFVLFLCLSVPAPAEERLHTLDLELWSRPRDGATLVTYPGLSRAVRELDGVPEGIMEIRYPGGEQGAVWADELGDWLVSLGLPSGRIRIVPGSTSPDRIELVVIRGVTP
ncbi:MAG: hypothetical protein PVG82_07280 [Chromatiales bacterium]|jgi:hypothetical protein